MANKSNNKVAKDVKNNKDKRHFMKEFKGELKKVIWPTPKQLFNNTVAVISIVFVITVIVLLLDIGLKAVNDQGINKLRTIVNNTTEQTTESNTASNTAEENVVENTITEDTVEDNTVVEENDTENVTEDSAE